MQGATAQGGVVGVAPRVPRAITEAQDEHAALDTTFSGEKVVLMLVALRVLRCTYGGFLFRGVRKVSVYQQVYSIVCDGSSALTCVHFCKSRVRHVSIHCCLATLIFRHLPRECRCYQKPRVHVPLQVILLQRQAVPRHLEIRPWPQPRPPP